MEAQHRHHKYRLIAAGIVALAVIVFGAVVILPLPAFSDPTFLRPRTGAALVASIIMLGAAVMILSTLGSFKKSLRIAYILVAAGIVSFAVSLTQLPVIGFFNAYNSWYVNSGLLVVPFVLATGLIYTGVRRFAKLLNIRGITTSFWFVTGVALVAAILSYLTAHIWATTLDVTGTDSYIATVAWVTVYAIAAAVLLRRITERIGPFYHDAMQQLFVALAVLSVAGTHEHLSSYWYGNPDYYVSHGVSTIPFILTGLATLRAAYTLCVLNNQAAVDQTDTAETNTETGPIEDREYSDAITYAASLSSHPNDIDFILDDLRLVTSNLEEGQALSPQDKRRLINVYLKVELYLTYHDPLRNFTREEIRSKLSPGLQAEINRRAPEVSAPPAETANEATTPAA
jgi:hypothetical protein